MSDLNIQRSATGNDYNDYVMLLPEISRLVNLAKYVSYIHLVFGFIRIFTPEVFWAILEFITLGCFGIYIFSKNSPIMHYLLYGLLSVFHSGCSILLFYISLLTWKIVKINDIYERQIQNVEEKLPIDQPIINRLKLSAISHLICGILCIINIYLVNKITSLIEEFNRLEIINHSEGENSLIYNGNINRNDYQIPNNYNTVEVFSGIARTLKDFPRE